VGIRSSFDCRGSDDGTMRIPVIVRSGSRDFISLQCVQGRTAAKTLSRIPITAATTTFVAVDVSKILPCTLLCAKAVERVNTLRANIDETLTAAVIGERGGKENHRERKQGDRSSRSRFSRSRSCGEAATAGFLRGREDANSGRNRPCPGQRLGRRRHSETGGDLLLEPA
jgi:hypothetical protein